MKWATKRGLGTQQPSAAWLILRFIDREAEFLFLAKESVQAEAAKVGAKTFYAPGADFNKDGVSRTTFDSLMEHYGLVGKDAALDLMAAILNDVSYRVKQGEAPNHLEAVGVRALIGGFKASIPDETVRLARMLDVYDALYAYCQGKAAAA